MSACKNPPEFSPKKPYDRYVEELKAWCIITDLTKDKQGVAVELSLPESDSSGIRNKVFSELTLDGLEKENGITMFIADMDSLFKDELSEVYERYVAFDRYKKDGNQKMDDFFLEFERCYNCAKQKEMELLQAVLAFKLLDAAQVQDVP